MGSTKCYDILIVQAKNKKLKSKTEPPEIDQELQSKINAERKKYESQANNIYGLECSIIDAKYKAKTLAVDAKKEISGLPILLSRVNFWKLSSFVIPLLPVRIHSPNYG